MALKLEVEQPLASSWTDISSMLEQHTWYIQENYGRQGATAYFVARDEFLDTAPHETNLTLVCKPLSKIRLTDGATNLFGGILTDPQLYPLGPTLAEYHLNCRDYTYYADSRLVTKSYLNMSAGAILTDMVNASQTGLTPDPTMPAGPNITAVQFDHVTISDAADQLSQLASWQSDYAMYVDYDLTLYWGNELYELQRVARGDYTPVTVSDAVVSDMTTTLAYIDKGAGQFYYEWDGSTIRNKATVRGGVKTSTWTDNFTGDGNTKQWVLTFDVNQSGNFTVTVAGTSRTVEVTTDPSHPTREYMFFQNANGQWSLIVGTASTPASGDAIVVTYSAQTPIIGSFENAASEAQYDGPNGGVYEVYVSDNTLKDVSSCYARARAEVQQFGLAQERITMTLAENFPGHIRAGQVFVLQSNFIPDARNDWNVGFSDYFVATQVTILGRESGRRQYQIQGVRFAQNS